MVPKGKIEIGEAVVVEYVTGTGNTPATPASGTNAPAPSPQPSGKIKCADGIHNAHMAHQDARDSTATFTFGTLQSFGHTDRAPLRETGANCIGQSTVILRWLVPKISFFA